MKRTRTRIFLERRKVIVVKALSSDTEAFCALCGRDVRMFSPIAAAAHASVDASAIYGEVARKTIHFNETAQGLLLICGESLNRIFMIK
jgi:hypothetical protein